MSFDAIAAAGITTAPASGAAKSQTKLAADFDQFLKLLTTQLQYQDPLNPMDSGEFTNQLVSFTGVEQSIATNKNLENLINQTKNAAMSNAVGYLGTEITVETDRAGLRNGQAKWEYGLQSNADDVQIVITDSTGYAVYEGTGQNRAGLNEFTWDAPADTPDGIYQMQITAKTAGGSEVQTTIYSKGTVESIEALDGIIYMSANGILTSADQIQAVKPLIPSEENAG